MNRPLSQKEIRAAERPLSEEFRQCAIDWADAEHAASREEELKSTVLEQRKSAMIAKAGDMPDIRAERIVKSDPDTSDRCVPPAPRRTG